MAIITSGYLKYEFLQIPGSVSSVLIILSPLLLIIEYPVQWVTGLFPLG
jgi:hypothetical protein